MGVADDEQREKGEQENGIKLHGDGRSWVSSF
jgi:hypothetical protein